MFQDLREYLHALRSDRDLVTVEVEVDPDLELAEIHRRVIAAGGPALLFTNVKGSDFPLATNLFGTPRRVERAFGRDPQRFLERLVAVASRAHPPGPGDLWGLRDLAAKGLSVGMKTVAEAPVTEVVSGSPALGRLPFVRQWPEDGGGFLTLPLVYTEHPDDGRHNLGIYRVQRYDDRTTGMHWQIGKGGGFHHARAEEKGSALPVAIHLGGPPALMLSAIAPLPENVPELLLASLVQGGRLERVASPVAGFPLPLVARSEVALCGGVPPGVRRPEGPFGDHYGYYSLAHDYPVFECRAVCRRARPIVPATIVGKPRQEDFFLGDYLQELLSPLFPLVMPAVRSLWSYGETGFHSLSAAVVRERYPGEALASAFRILGEGQLSLTKFLMLTDQPVELRDFRSLLVTVLERTRFETDLRIFGRTSMDSLDYAGPTVNKGSKGVWMGLGDPVRQLPEAVPAGLPRGVTRAEVLVPGCLVVEGPGFEEDRGFPATLASAGALSEWPLVVLVDHGVGAAASVERFLWVAFTRFAPETDLHPRRFLPAGFHVGVEPPVVLDARKKPWYPAEVECDPATEERVRSRWDEYFPAGGVERG